MQLLRKSESGEARVEDSAWLVVDVESEVADDVAVAIPLSRYVSEASQWDAREAPWTVVIEPADDLLTVPAALLERAEVLISFPAFTDGRGYSHARTLQHHHGYTGEMVAIGDVRRDQLEFMRETGFSAFQITGNDSVDAMLHSLTELSMPAHRLYSGAAVPAGDLS